MKAFKENKRVKIIFYFLRPISIALIANALLTIIMGNLIILDKTQGLGFSVKIVPLILTVVLFALSKTKLLKKEPLLILLLSAVLGLAFSL